VGAAAPTSYNVASPVGQGEPCAGMIIDPGEHGAWLAYTELESRLVCEILY
jgi:hypothetical protein